MKLITNKGFTLIEFIMILVIILIGASIIAPRIEKFITAWDLDIESRKLRLKIREAQQLAISKQQTCRVEFDINEEDYVLSLVSPDSEVETVDLKQSVDLFSTSFTNPSSNTLDFDQFGAPSEAGNIVLKDTNNNSTTISVAAATGRVIIQ